MDHERIRANGPWILVKPEPVRKTTKGGLYVPDGNLYERLGHIVAQVISAGKGYHEVTNKKTKFVRCNVSPGDRVVFRGHLKDANKVGNGYCFLHMRDVVGKLDEGDELDLAMPYDN